MYQKRVKRTKTIQVAIGYMTRLFRCHVEYQFVEIPVPDYGEVRLHDAKTFVVKKNLAPRRPGYRGGR